MSAFDWFLVVFPGLMLASFYLGRLFERADARFKIAKREASQRLLRSEIRDPVDVPFDVVARRAGSA